MELFGCATRGELYVRLRSGTNYMAWMFYLEYKEELENERMKDILGEK